MTLFLAVLLLACYFIVGVVQMTCLGFLVYNYFLVGILALSGILTFTAMGYYLSDGSNGGISLLNILPVPDSNLFYLIPGLIIYFIVTGLTIKRYVDIRKGRI